MLPTGNGLWLDKAKSQCLILWKKLPDWAKDLHQWAHSIGLEDSVTTVDEITSGEDCRGTGGHALPMCYCAQVLGQDHAKSIDNQHR